MRQIKSKQAESRAVSCSRTTLSISFSLSTYSHHIRLPSHIFLRLLTPLLLSFLCAHLVFPFSAFLLLLLFILFRINFALCSFGVLFCFPFIFYCVTFTLFYDTTVNCSANNYNNSAILIYNKDARATGKFT